MRKRRIAYFFLIFFLTSANIFSFGSEKDKGAFKLYDPGTDEVIDYSKYGGFEGVGAFEYKYTIKDPEGLAKASGEGIDPSASAWNDPAHQELIKEKRIKKSCWKHVDSGDPEADFFAWATEKNEDPGIRLYFTGRALEAAGLFRHALKAYYACMILYPATYCFNREGTWTWLTAPAAWSAIINLTRMYPELELKLEGAYIKTEVAIKGDPTKNRVAVTPGYFKKYTEKDRKNGYYDASKLKITEKRGKKVSVVKYSNGAWGMRVDGRPFMVKGVYYGPTKVEKKYDWNWMFADENRNKINDVAYETWVDKNKNNKHDKDEEKIGDFALLKEMGCNTIRIFNTLAINKDLLRDMYGKYGIRVLICDPLGAYTVHSGADWMRGTDYTDERQLESMKKAARETVMECKDEEWLLGYILGNENNMPADYTGVNASRTRAAIQPESYAKFLNETAKMIHELDPDHPVGVGNMGFGLIEYYAKYAPELDFIGVNDYPGKNGFGSLWIQARTEIDRPILITEYGCDAYWTDKGVDEETQAEYHENSWDDILYNSAGSPGEGNSIGGVIFEWLDEWWKDSRGDSWASQNTDPTCEMAFPDGWSQEEWLGIVGQGNGSNSPFLRDLRKAYFVYKKKWNE